MGKKQTNKTSLIKFHLAVQEHFISRVEYLRVIRDLLEVIKPIFSFQYTPDTVIKALRKHPPWRRTHYFSTTSRTFWHLTFYCISGEQKLSGNGIRRWTKLGNAGKREEWKEDVSEKLWKGLLTQRAWGMRAVAPDGRHHGKGSWQAKGARLPDCRRLPLGWGPMLGFSLHISKSES